MSTNHKSITIRLLMAAAFCGSLLVATTSGVLAAAFSYTPNVANNSVELEGLIPVKQFMNVPLPRGTIEFDDGTLAVNIVPNWNFDRVAVLQGPIIRTEVTTNGREAVVSGVVLFTQGWWYDRYWTEASRETIVTSGGASIVGKITDMSATTLTITPQGSTTATTVALADIKELHSPRAYAFAVPALAPGTITPNTSWNADVQAITLAPTVETSAGPVLANLSRDPLLKTTDDGDWSNKKMIMIGTALSLVNLAQFAPEVILPQYSHYLWGVNNKKAFTTVTTPVPSSVAPLGPGGTTYSLP